MNKILCGFSIICVIVFSVQAQFENEGKLNVWATEKVQRNPRTENYSSGICKIKVSQHKGFDRIVFQFDNGKPTYVAQYLPSDIYQTEGKGIKIKIAGERFLMLNIYYFAVDDMPCKLKTYPKKKLNSPTLMQIEEGGWFEGILDFIVGVKNNKPFRVKELRNPSRLIIDFRH